MKSIYNKVASYYITHEGVYSMKQKSLFHTYLDVLKRYEDFINTSLNHMDELRDYDILLMENSKVLVKMIDSVYEGNYFEIRRVIENECSYINNIIYNNLVKWGKRRGK